MHRPRIPHLVCAAIVLGALLLPASPAASLAGFAVYEDWQDGIIHSSRWIGGEDFGGQEVQREVTPEKMLELRYRRAGSTASNTGSTATSLFLDTADPTRVRGIAATFTVTALDMTTCAANNAGSATRARPARLLVTRFNDGTQSAPGNRIGDYVAGVQAFRDGSSTDPSGVLKVAGFIARCTNASCGTSTIIIANTLPTTVSVGETFTLRIQWDQPNHQFLFGLNGGADVALPYAASDTAPANVPFVNIDERYDIANCTAGAAAIDSTTLVGTVLVTMPGVTITTPTSNAAFSASATSLTIGGTATTGVTQITWTNSLGGSGTASGTTNWTASVPLQQGSNVITVTAQDADGNTGTATLTANNALGAISGKVTQGDGVTLIPTPPGATSCSNGLTCVSVSPDSPGGIFKTVAVAADGTYSVTDLPAGSYHVQAQGDGFATQWYDAKASQQLGQSVAVTGNATTSGINFKLPSGAGGISGHLSQGGTPLANTQVCFSLSSGGLVLAVQTDAQGNYDTRRRLAAGTTYKLQICQDGVPNVFNDGAASSSVALPIPVSSGATTTQNTDIVVPNIAAAGIAGLVTSAISSLPLGGATITVLDAATNTFVAGATSLPDGSYSTGRRLLPPGPYKLQAAASGFATQFFDGEPTAADATLVAVTAGTDATGKNFQLSPGGAITGNVTGPPTSSNVTIDVFDAAGNALVSGKSINTTNGTYTISGLMPGLYKVRARLANFATTFYGGGRTLVDVNTLVVLVTEGGSSQADIAMAVAGGITGTVTNTSNVGLGGGTIDVYDANNNLIESTTTASSGTIGSYTIRRFQAGIYKVRARALNFATTFNADKHTFATADLIVVSSGGDTTVNIKLASGSDIRGRITDSSGAPVFGAVVDLYEPSAINFVEGGFVTAADGTYTTQSRLPAGSYVIRARRGNSFASVGMTLYNGKRGFATADPVTVGAAQVVTGKDIQMDPGAGISGTITDGVNPLPGVQVDIIDASTGSALTDTFLQLSVRTNADGFFDTGPTFSTNGQYKLRARLFPGGRIDTFSIGAIDLFSASLVSAPGIVDMALPAGGTITGTIREQGTHAPLPGATVLVSRFAANTYSGAFTVLTDSNGNFTIGGMHDGEWYVRAQHPTHFRAFYSGQPDNPATDMQTATPILIASAGTVGNVDINLTPGTGVIRGMIRRHDNGFPIPAGSTVQLRTETPRTNFIASAQVSSFNLCPGAANPCNYEVSGLPPESYVIEAFGNTLEQDTAIGWYALPVAGALGATSRATPLTVPVSAGGTATADFEIPAFTGGGARTISGFVTDSGGTPLKFVEIGAFDPGAVSSSRFVQTNGDGSFFLNHLSPGKYLVRADTETGFVASAYGLDTTNGLPGQPYPEPVLGASAVIDVTGGDATGIEIKMPFNASTISGTISRVCPPVDPSGCVQGTLVGIMGVSVSVRNFLDNGVVGAVTRADGSYLVRGVAPGSYKIRVSAPGPGFITCYYRSGNQTCHNQDGSGLTFDDGSFITVTPGVELTNINMILDPGGGNITGKVLGPGDVPVVGALIEAREAVSGARVYVAASAVDGTYLIPQLATGTYKLRVLSVVPGFVSRWYDDKGTQGTADAVSVTQPGTTANVDFLVSTNEGSFSGRVTHGATPVAGAGVLVFDTSGDFVLVTAVTGKDGKYTRLGLAPGSYIAQVRGLGDAPNYLGGVPDVQTAQAFAIDVEAGTDTPGQDFNLTTTSDIAGTIAYSGQQTGTLEIGLYSDAALTHRLYRASIPFPVFPQPYSFTKPSPDTQGLVPGTYYVAAFIDSNPNGVQDASEARGKFGEATAIVLAEGAIVTGKNFSLTDPVTPGTGTTSSSKKIPQVVNGNPRADLGDIRIKENATGALANAGRVRMTLPAGLRFVDVPVVSLDISNGMTICTGADAPRVDDTGVDRRTFSFMVCQKSTTGPATIAISGPHLVTPDEANASVSVDVADHFPDGPVSVNIDSTAVNGLTPAVVQNASLIPLPPAPALTAIDVIAVGQGVNDRDVVLTGFNLDQLTFTGANHDTIDFGPGIDVIDIAPVDATHLRVRIRINAGAQLGAHDVIITNNPSGEQLLLQGRFTVDPPPTVTAAGTTNATQPLRSPLTGDVLKGQVVTIIGTGFQPPTTVPSDLVVAFSGTGITVIAVNYTSPTQISVEVEVAKGAESEPQRTVTVKNPDLGVGIGAGVLTVEQASPGEPEGGLPKPKTSPPPPAPPSVISVVPSAAPTGAIVTVNGSGFGSTLAAIAVTFAGPNGARLTGTVSKVLGGASVQVQVPATAVDGPVKVAVSGGQSSTSADFTVTNPLIDRVNPESGMRATKVSLDLTGTKFQSGATVAFTPPNDLSLSPVTILDASHAQLTVTIGAAAALGIRDVTITNPDGASSTVLQAFEVKPNTPLALVLSLKTVGAQASVIDPGELLPSIQSVEVTLDASGKCTERRIVPSLYLLEASFVTPPATPPPSLTFTLTSSALPGTATNDDCEPNLALPEPLPAEFDWSIGPVNGAVNVASQQLVASNEGGVYRAWLASWDYGGSVRIDIADNASAPTVTASLALPADTDKDGLPDAYEQNGALNGDKLGVNVLNFVKADLNGNGMLDGQDKFVADGLTNFEKYRGVYLVAPRAPTASLQPLGHHQRLGAGKRNLFVRGRGFATDPTLPDGMCGLNSVTGAPVPRIDTSFPCPRFQYGTAFDQLGVRIWDVTGSFDAAGTTVFPTQSLADPTKPMLDLATVTLDAANCSGGASCDHTNKRGTRQWNFPTLGYSTFGTPKAYGAALVLFRAIKAYFGDRPYLHQENLPGTFLPVAPGTRPMLAPITIVCDRSPRGGDNGSVQTGECSVDGVPGGDVYVAGAFDKDMTAMDVNNDGCVELPFVSDPTTLPSCDKIADSAAAPQATFQQVIRSVVTHELGHAAAINIHTSDATDLMYMYSINWTRDGHFSPQAGSLVQIHNKGGP